LITRRPNRITVKKPDMKFITKNKSLLKGAAMLTGVTLMSSVNAFAAEAPKPSEMSNPLAISLVVVAAVLLLAIGILAYVVIGAAKYYVEKLKEQKANEASVATKVLSIIALSLLSTSVFAAAEPTAEVVTNIGGLAKSS
jgi:cytochrome c oxidase cbb3-type subunit III